MYQMIVLYSLHLHDLYFNYISIKQGKNKEFFMRDIFVLGLKIFLHIIFGADIIKDAAFGKDKKTAYKKGRVCFS